MQVVLYNGHKMVVCLGLFVFIVLGLFSSVLCQAIGWKERL